MFGIVTIAAATLSSSSRSRASPSMEPSEAVGICVTVKPAIAAVAGFVPWALSGTSTRRLRPSSPRSSSARFTISTPASSPCAPAAGARLDAAKPVSEQSASCSSCPTRRIPCTRSSASSGWASASPGSAAMRSSTFGLYFIVQEPSG